MEYMLFVATDTDPEPPGTAGGTIEEWVEEGERRGIRKQGDRLRPPEDATTIRVRNGELLVTDGPFTESKEVVGGYALVEVASREEALKFARRFMELHRVHWPAFEGECEVRPLEDM